MIDKVMRYQHLVTSTNPQPKVVDQKNDEAIKLSHHILHNLKWKTGKVTKYQHLVAIYSTTQSGRPKGDEERTLSHHIIHDLKWKIER